MIQQVAFDWNPENPEPGDEITFSAEQTVGDIVEYRWNFTGGTGFDEVTTDPVTSFTLSEEDTLEVTLEVEDESGAVASTTETVIEQQGVSPAFDWSPENPEPGQEVTFDASISQGGISEYRWDFDGDGTVDETTTEPTATYTFEEPDIYDVEMIAVGAVNTGSTDARINVSEPIRTTSFEFTPENPEPGQQITFDASVSEGEISEYRWDFTDSGEFDTVTSDPVVTHTFETEAVQSVTLEVQRADGMSSVTGSVVVGNPPSVVDAVFDYEPETPTVGQQVTFDAGDSTGDIAAYRWDFTDNQTPDRNTTDPVVTYTFDSPGEYPVTLAVVHDEENFDVTSKTLTVVE
jgi:PKD repeat protein